MSTVAAAIKDGYLCIASETQTSYGNIRLAGSIIENPSKIYKWGASYIGFVGNVSMMMVLIDLIETSTKDPDLSSPSKIFKFFKRLHPKLKKDYFVQAKEDDDDPVESSRFHVLIANKHGLFGLDPMREVTQYKEFWAIGSGIRFALGAMSAVSEMDDFDAEKVARAGVKAGVTFDMYSGGEILSHKIKLVKKKKKKSTK